MVILAVYRVIGLVRLKRQHVHFFPSNREMLLVCALVTVALIGILVESRKKKL
jgi:hypothetical protein